MSENEILQQQGNMDLRVEQNIILIDKETDWTSNDVVSVLKKRLNPLPKGEKKILEPGKKKFRIGHAGTLDPFATGLLLIMLNDGTKLFDELQKLKKEYIVEIEFGKKTDTQDITGEVVWQYDESVNGKIDLNHFTKGDLLRLLERFSGKIWQVPPKYSSIKINGQRLYKLAYKLSENKNISDVKIRDLDKALEEKKRLVEIYESEIISIQEKIMIVRFVVSSGTYIRTLAQDIGDSLGYGAFAKSLRRTKIGEFRVEDARKISGFLV